MHMSEIRRKNDHLVSSGQMCLFMYVCLCACQPVSVSVSVCVRACIHALLAGRLAASMRGWMGGWTEGCLLQMWCADVAAGTT